MKRRGLVGAVVAGCVGLSGCAGDGPNPVPPEPLIQARIAGCGLAGTVQGGAPVGPGVAVRVLDAEAGVVLATGTTGSDGCYEIELESRALALGARFQVEGRVGAVPLRAMLLERAMADEQRYRADWSVSSEVCTLGVVASLEAEGRALDSLSLPEVILVRAACDLVALAPSEAPTPAEQIEEVAEVAITPATSPVRGILDAVGTAPAPEELTDPDGDGVPTEEDLCPASPDAEQGDRDADGVGDVCDDCPATFDPDQLDADGDGLGDACHTCLDPFDPACAEPRPTCDPGPDSSTGSPNPCPEAPPPGPDDPNPITVPIVSG